MLADKTQSKSTISPFQLSTIANNGVSTSTTSASSLTATNKTALAGASVKAKHDQQTSIANWTVTDVEIWARNTECFSKEVVNCLRNEEIDGKVLLALCENDIRDMRYRLNYKLSFGDLKKLWLSIHELQERYLVTKATNHIGVNSNCLMNGTCPLLYSNATSPHNVDTTPVHRRNNTDALCYHHSDNRDVHTNNCLLLSSEYIPNVPAGGDSDVITPPMSVDGRAVNIPPEFFKTFISLGYSFLVTWITSFVMVIVHERVPDMKRYPPLPDIFLDNVPHIPWAFHMCEITGTLLFAIWSCVCIFHKYRMVLLRRFFALAGTVFLLRCVTMLITSLSVPGTHLQCDQSDYAVDDTDLTLTEALELRVSRAYTIWSGLGMSIQGVRTCGDYMFSGHTVALTLLNFFITEYTPRNLYFLHTLTWLLNMFGIFFILAAHEHYSIDVFVAFYITSRLFLYYHTLANNQALMSRDSTRTRIWFPMFSYFESSVEGIIPNEFDTLSSLFEGVLRCLMDVKDSIMMTAQRLSVDPPQLAMATKNLLLPVSKEHRHASTSTQSAASVSSTHFAFNTDEEENLLGENANGVPASLTVNYETANGNTSGDISFINSPKSSGFNLNNNDTVAIRTASVTALAEHNNSENVTLQASVTSKTKKFL